MTPAASGAAAPRRTSHARVSSSPVVRNVMRSIAAIARGDHLLEARLLHAELLQQGARLVRIHLRGLSFDRREHADGSDLGERGRHVGGLFQVGDHDLRFQRERRDPSQLGDDVGLQLRVAQRRLGLERNVRRMQRRHFVGGLAFGALLEPCATPSRPRRGRRARGLLGRWPAPPRGSRRRRSIGQQAPAPRPRAASRCLAPKRSLRARRRIAPGLQRSSSTAPCR